jgi:membrane protease YdiL (CAAX protease family)
VEIRQLLAFASELIGAIAVTMLLTLNPKVRQHPRLEFKVPRREGVLSLALFAGMFLLAVLVYGGQLRVIEILPQNSPSDLQSLYQNAAVALVGALICLTALVYRRQPLRSAGWNRPLFSASLQLGLAIAILTVFLHGKFATLLKGVSADQGLALLLLLLLGLAEETVFRGYIHLRLSSWFGPTRGWLATAGLYVIWYLPRLIGRLPVNELLLVLGLLLLQGLLLGWMMQKGKHVLAPALYRAISGWIAFFP